MKIAAWLSDDSFEQVLGFYRAIGKEYTRRRSRPRESCRAGSICARRS
jgi:hypothetical protein